METTVYVTGTHSDPASKNLRGFTFTLSYEGSDLTGQVLGIGPQSDLSLQDALAHEFARLAEALQTAGRTPQAIVVGQVPAS